MKFKTKLINFIIIKILKCRHYYRIFKINNVNYGDSIDAINYYNNYFNSLSTVDLFLGKINNILIYKYIINDIFKRKAIYRTN